jgi:hypothetical protein
MSVSLQNLTRSMALADKERDRARLAKRDSWSFRVYHRLRHLRTACLVAYMLLVLTR